MPNIDVTAAPIVASPDPATTFAVGTATGSPDVVRYPLSALGAAPANPTGAVALAAANGTAETFMRSDAAPALDQGITPTWSAKHTFTLGAEGGAAYTPVDPKDFVTKEALDAGVASASPVVASAGANAKVANVNTPNVYAVAASGLFRISAFLVVSQAATVSSVMPSCHVTYTEAITNTPVQDIVTLSANTNLVGLHTGGSVVIQARIGTNIGYTTADYASVGATPMQYSVQLKVEALGS